MQAILCEIVIIHDSHFACSSGCCGELGPLPNKLFCATKTVHLSRMVTSTMSFNGRKDALPIVLFPGNAYRAPHIRTEILSVLQGGILEPRYGRTNRNEKRTSISTGCAGGFFLGRRGAQTVSGGRGDTRRQRPGRVYPFGDDAPSRLPDSIGPPPSLAFGNENHDAHHGKSSSPPRGTPVVRHLDPRLCSGSRRTESMGPGAHAHRI